jgi:hypothetical protein
VRLRLLIPTRAHSQLIYARSPSPPPEPRYFYSIINASRVSFPPTPPRLETQPNTLQKRSACLSTLSFSPPPPLGAEAAVHNKVPLLLAMFSPTANSPMLANSTLTNPGDLDGTGTINPASLNPTGAFGSHLSASYTPSSASEFDPDRKPRSNVSPRGVKRSRSPDQNHPGEDINTGTRYLIVSFFSFLESSAFSFISSPFLPFVLGVACLAPCLQGTTV